MREGSVFDMHEKKLMCKNEGLFALGVPSLVAQFIDYSNEETTLKRRWYYATVWQIHSALDTSPHHQHRHTLLILLAITQCKS